MPTALRARELLSHLEQLESADRGFEEERAALPTSISLSADLVAASVSTTCLLVAIVPLSLGEPALAWALLAGSLAAWIPPASSWVYGLVRGFVACVVIGWLGITLAGALSQPELPIARLAAMAILFLLIVWMVKVFWRRGSRWNRGAAFLVSALVAGAAIQVVVTHRTFVADALAAEALHRAEVRRVFEDPSGVLAELDTATAANNQYGAAAALARLDEALPETDPRLVAARGRVGELLARLEAEEAQRRAARQRDRRRRDRADRAANARLDRCINACAARGRQCYARGGGYDGCRHLPSIIDCGNRCTNHESGR